MFLVLIVNKHKPGKHKKLCKVDRVCPALGLLMVYNRDGK